MPGAGSKGPRLNSWREANQCNWSWIANCAPRGWRSHLPLSAPSWKPREEIIIYFWSLRKIHSLLVFFFLFEDACTRIKHKNCATCSVNRKINTNLLKKPVVPVDFQTGVPCTSGFAMWHKKTGLLVCFVPRGDFPWGILLVKKVLLKLFCHFSCG